MPIPFAANNNPSHNSPSPAASCQIWPLKPTPGRQVLPSPHKLPEKRHSPQKTKSTNHSVHRPNLSSHRIRLLQHPRSRHTFPKRKYRHCCSAIHLIWARRQTIHFNTLHSPPVSSSFKISSPHTKICFLRIKRCHLRRLWLVIACFGCYHPLPILDTLLLPS